MRRMAIAGILARFAGLLGLLGIFTAQVHGQGAYIPAKQVLSTVNGQLRGIQATITVCAPNTAGLPCAPASANTLFKDAALTQPLANPTTTDALGNYPQMALAGGNYTITETAAGFVGFSYQLSVSCPGTGGSCSVTTLTVSGTATLNGPVTMNCKSIEGIACVDAANTQGWSPCTDQGVCINTALASLTGAQGKVWVFGSGVWSTNIWAGITRPATVQFMDCGTVTTGVTQIPNNAYQKLLGLKPGCSVIFLNNASFDLLQPAATNFEFGNFMVRTNVTRTAGWVVNPSGAGTQGFYHDLYLLDTYNGIKFAGSAGASPSNQNIERLVTNETGGTHSGTMVQLGGGDGSGVSAFSITHWLDVGDLATHDTPKFVIDTGVDTVHVSDFNANYSQGNPSTQPVLAIQKSVLTGSNIAPRWITFDGHTSMEGGYDGVVTGADCVSITAGNNIVFQRLYAVSCNRGVVIGNTNSAPTGITISSGNILSNKAGGIVNTVAITNLDLAVGAVNFVNNSRAATNTTDDISILAGTTGFSVIGARFGTNALGAVPAQKSRYAITLGGAGTDLFSILGNDCNISNQGTGCINDPATALNAIVQDGFADVGQAAMKIYSNCQSTNICLELANTNPGGQKWRIGEFFANGNLAFRNGVTGTAYTFVGAGGNFERRFNSTLTAARDWTFQDASGTVPLTIASGTTTLTSNAALAAVTSQAANTTAAVGTLTTDSIEWSFATAPTAGDNLCHVLTYVTAGNVNFVRTNPTAAAQNVSALVINWRVIR